MPILVSVPVEAPITPETIPFPEPSSVNALVPLVIAATVISANLYLLVTIFMKH